MIRPRAAARPSDSAAAAMARSVSASSASASSTSWPCSASSCAIPRPIVPAPTTTARTQRPSSAERDASGIGALRPSETYTHVTLPLTASLPAFVTAKR